MAHTIAALSKVVVAREEDEMQSRNIVEESS